MESIRIQLPYGARPYDLELPTGTCIADLPAGVAGGHLRTLVEDALAAPIASPRVEDLVRPGDRVVIVVSDETRDDPRQILVDAVLDRLPTDAHVTLAVANGTHAPANPERLELGPRAARLPLVNHDSRDAGTLVEVGVTRRGTPVRVNRCAAEADVVIATGRIKPHYFAGFGAGCKAVFPGLGANDAVRINHRLKREAGAVPGSVDGNPCRADLEEATRMVGGARFLVNAVLDADGNAQAAVAGDVDAAFRRGAEACRRWFTVRAPRSSVVIVSDHLPLTASLYQASKLVAAVAPLVMPGGLIVLVAECGDGVGPLETVNRGIYELGIAPRLPEQHQVVLVSSLDRATVAGTYCRWSASVDDALAGRQEKPVVLPRAGTAVVEVDA